MMKFKSKMAKWGASVALAVASMGAGATTTDLGLLSSGATTFSGSAPVGGFMDYFKFELPSNNGTGYQVSNFPLSFPGISLNTVFSSLSLMQNSDGVLFNADDTFVTGVVGANLNTLTINTTSLASGKYYLIVSGIANGSVGGAYTGAISVAAPIPEPESYALLLAGLGLVGTMVMRRRAN